MNKYFNIAFTSLLAAGLVSCAVEDMPLNDVNSDIISISTTISDHFSTSTKAQIGENGSGNFENGDAVSLFVTPEGSSSAEHRELSLAPEGWTPQMKWSEFGADRAVFTAFYPVVDAGESYLHSISEDQTTEDGYRVSDLLAASVSASKGDNVNLNFAHLMSRVKVVISASGETTPEDLASAKVRIATSKNISVSLSDMALGQTSGNLVNVTPMRSGNIFRAVVCPEAIRKEWKEDAWIVVELGGKTYKYKAPATLDSKSFEKLESGKEVTINITLNRKPVEPEPEPQPQPGDFAGKTVWVKGLKNMPDPSEWKCIETVPAKRYGLKWDASYGWYDCNKIYPYGMQNGPVLPELSGKPDMNLCWAAAASNMIYWWFDTNKEYIERYGKYTGPKLYTDSFHAEVFDHFKNNFWDEGNDVNATLNWFFTGRNAAGLGVSASEGAFFKDVIGEGEVASELFNADDGRFTQVVKDALAAGKVIGFNHTFPNRTLHAINLWGATFDDSGEITYIYVTDSNNGSYEGQVEGPILTPAGLEKRAVKVIDGDTCMESSAPGKFSLPIVNVYTISPMTDKWEAYFNKQ